MRLAKVGFHGIDPLPDEAYDFCKPGQIVPQNRIVITGPPGSGKTAFLEAIAIAKEEVAPYGGHPRRRLMRHDRSSAKITMEWWLDEEEVRRVGGDARRPSEALFGEGILGTNNAEPDDGLREVLSHWSTRAPKVEYFHADRRIEATPWPRPSRISPSQRLKCDNTKYDGTNEFIVEAVMGLADENVAVEDPRSKASRFRAAFESLCGSKVFRGVTVKPEGTFAGFSAKKADRPFLTLKELSHAEKQALIFASTFIRCGLDRSVVLIDSPELFLPTADVEHFLGVLEGMGNNQLIIATSSSSIVQRTERAALIQLPGV